MSLCVQMATFEILIIYEMCPAVSDRTDKNLATKAAGDSKIQAGRDTVAPSGDIDISWAAGRVAGDAIFRQGPEQRARQKKIWPLKL